MAINRNTTQVTNQQLIQQSKEYNDMLKRLNEMNQKYSGKPDRPAWESLLDKDGTMKNVYELKNAYNQDALKQMRQEAMRDPGEASQWRQLQQEKLEQQAGKASSAAQGATAASLNQMAMRGGVGSGSMERLTAQGAQNALMAQQGVMGRGIDLDIQDESNRLQQLGAVNQANLAAGQNAQGIQQYNIDKALFETLQKRADNLNAYNEQMRAWAAERTAAATPSGGGGGKK